MKTEDIEKGISTVDKALSLSERLINALNDNIPGLKANQLYIKEIENSDKLSTPEKMALLYNAKPLKKQMQNLYSVYELADIMLKDKGSSLDESELDNESEWFGMFSDIAKNVSDEEMQHIWAKILASKCEDKKSVDKKLLSILQVMEYNDAEIFSYICANSVMINAVGVFNLPVFVYYFDSDNVNLWGDCGIYDKNLINHVSLNQMQSLGLITYHSSRNATFCICQREKLKVDFNMNYFDEKIKIKSSVKKELNLGVVELTKSGCQLVNILYNDQRPNKNLMLIDKLIEHYKKLGYEANRI